MMKPITLILAAMVLAVVPGTGMAAPAGARINGNPNATHFRGTQDFSEIVDMPVWNLQNEKLGRLKSFTVDLQNGRLVEMVVSTGGWMGMGGKELAVAPRALKIDTGAQVLRLDVTKERFLAGPRFDASHTNAATARQQVAGVLRYYGLQPWFFMEGQPVVKNAEILELGHVRRVDQVMEMQIFKPEGGYVGKVGSVFTDLPKGQIVHVVAVARGMGYGDRSVIQARALRYNAAHSALVLENNPTQLEGEPGFKWMSPTSFRQETYVNREVEADNGLHSRQNAQEGRVGGADAMQQGANFRDVQKTNVIRQAIQADATLSANAKNVEVVTLNGQTTLRGHVNTSQGKQRIGQLAVKSGLAENVSNMLEVRALR